MSELPSTPRSEAEHVMAQVAACRRTVGVALVPAVGVFELRGPASELTVVARQLTGRRPVTGCCVRMRGGWWRTETPGRARILADAGDLPEVEALLERLVVSRLDVALSDLSAAHAALILAGPLAGRLAASPAARLAQPLMAVCDGDDYHVLVVGLERAGDTRHVLLEAGRADGAVAVGARATELHRAARRIGIARRAPVTPELSIHTTTTGAPAS
jgi:hypothetical protein